MSDSARRFKNAVKTVMRRVHNAKQVVRMHNNLSHKKFVDMLKALQQKDSYFRIYQKGKVSLLFPEGTYEPGEKRAILTQKTGRNWTQNLPFASLNGAVRKLENGGPFLKVEVLEM